MNQFFVEALDTREHPIKKAKMKIQAEYITALTSVSYTHLDVYKRQLPLPLLQAKRLKKSRP